MSILSSQELADMRAAANASLDKTCVIQRATKSQHATGYSTETWATIATVSARMSVPTGSYMQNIAERLADLKTWLVTLPYGTDVAPRDQLVIDGQTLTAQTVFAPQSNATTLRLLASELV